MYGSRYLKSYADQYMYLNLCTSLISSEIHILEILVYSGTSILRTPWGPQLCVLIREVSLIQRLNI